MNDFTLAVKGGVLPSSRGRRSNQGKIVHVIPGKPLNGFWDTPSLCKATPGNRGFGWLETDRSPVTCKKCLEILKESDRDD